MSIYSEGICRGCGKWMKRYFFWFRVVILYQDLPWVCKECREKLSVKG